jgi:glycosyltransferase involved in cell wall biosynthesis
MRILIFTQYFTPEIGATQTRVHSFAAGLAARDHEVTVIAEVPNHPQGVVHPGFRGRPLVRRQLDGFHARYVWVATKPEKTSLDRIMFYGSYAAMAMAAGMARRRPDVVLASSPPLPVAAAAAAVARRHRVPWVMDVRDLWPDAAVALGELADPRALRAAEWLEDRLYEDAAAITPVTEPFRDAIAAKVARAEKITVIPNGTNRFWLGAADREVDRERLGMAGDRFVWTFAGNVGLAQGLDAAVDAAGLLGEGYQLLIVGDGAARAALERRAAALAEDRVVFRGQVPPELAASYLRASDALLVPLAPDPVLRSFVPSKLFDFCAVGRPVILAAAGEPQRLADASDAALSVPPGDAAALAAGVRQLSADESLRRRLSDNGAKFARTNLRERQVGRLADLLVATAEA